MCVLKRKLVTKGDHFGTNWEKLVTSGTEREGAANSLMIRLRSRVPSLTTPGPRCWTLELRAPSGRGLLLRSGLHCGALGREHTILKMSSSLARLIRRTGHHARRGANEVDIGRPLARRRVLRQVALLRRRVASTPRLIGSKLTSSSQVGHSRRLAGRTVAMAAKLRGFHHSRFMAYDS